MSQVIDAAVQQLNARLGGSYDGTAKFVITGEGTVFIDQSGAREGDGEADVTLTASRETFEGIMTGASNPTMAYMSGKLKIDGSLPAAMKLGAALS